MGGNVLQVRWSWKASLCSKKLTFEGGEAANTVMTERNSILQREIGKLLK